VIAMYENALEEGSFAVAEAIKLCRPKVISAYPITPQTHIVEDLSQMVADGEIDCEYVVVESEFAAASVVMGASTAGVRTYTATTSQGLFLMYEVLYNIAGSRLPINLTCANRAVSAPISIWNDQQDSVSVRDAGWLQIYCEDSQEVHDFQPIAYRVGENPKIRLPVMIMMDGFVLTHTYEPIRKMEQAQVDEYLPPYEPVVKLDVKHPKTFGAFAMPDTYHEIRYMLNRAVMNSKGVLETAFREFGEVFGREYNPYYEEYRTEDADTIIVSLGSVCGTIKDAVDQLRDEGKRVGLLKMRTVRPFPAPELRKALDGASTVAVIEKDISLGHEGTVSSDLKAAFHRHDGPVIHSFVAGLGGRDITIRDIKWVHDKAASLKGPFDGPLWVGLNEDIIPEVV
jgi:pyruvate ferredoxin oxidoreductase alpha subunit